MSDFQDIELNNQMTPWQQTAAFNTYWTYSFVSRAAFYSMVGSRYFDFMNRWVKNWLWWYDGYVPYFHNEQTGIFSTRLATAIVDRTAQKVVGGRIMFKNAGKESQDQRQLNKGLLTVTHWAKDVDFEKVVKRATKYAAAAGTALVKLNTDTRGLWTEALRFDSFLPVVDFRGKLVDIKCFLQQYTNLTEKGDNTQQVDSYYIVEHRFFGRYERADGSVINNAPIATYEVHKASGTITTGNYVSLSSEAVQYRDLPTRMRAKIAKDYTYGQLRFGEPILLPFADSLGAELITWTEGVSNIPELPFGESLLSNLISLLQSYDYYFSAFNTDMYTGRARVLVPKGMVGKGAERRQANAGLDGYMYTQVEMLDPEKQTPIPLQFELRSSDWSQIRDTIIQNISINTGLNISTIASFLNDTTGNKTAREISTEENETLAFVNYKRALLEKPLNRLLKTILRYNGIADDVVLRWSNAELTNRALLSEILSTAVNGGFLSKKKAVEMFNFDDDDEQVQAEYDLIVDDEKNSAFGGQPMAEGEEPIYDDQDEPQEGEEVDDTESDRASGDDNGSGKPDKARGAKGFFERLFKGKNKQASGADNQGNGGQDK